MATTAKSPNLTKTELVEELLTLCQGTDAGINAELEKRTRIENIISQIARFNSSESFLDDPTIFDNYFVTYSRSRQSSEPAGGLYRSKIGRLIFKTRALFQHVIQPGIVVNAVSFRFLGIIPGIVVLRGKLTALAKLEPGVGKNAAAIDFDRPFLRIGPALFQFGPKSRVRLSIVHLDDHVRIGIGRRGTLLVFTRCPQDTPFINDWKDVVDGKPLPTILLPLGIVAILAATFLAPLLVRLAALAVFAGVYYVLRFGGNASNAPDAYRDRVISQET